MRCKTSWSRSCVVVVAMFTALGAFAEPPVALTHVTLIDGTGAAPRADMTLVFTGGVITSVAPSATAAVPDGATVVDLRGRTIIPGLVDTHVHLATDPSGEDRRPLVERRLRTALYGGVTAVRDMAGDGRALADLARAALLQEIEAPAIVYSTVMGGPVFFSDPRVQASSRGVTPGSAPWAREITAATDWRLVIAEAKGSGASGIKLYADVPAGVIGPAVAEAHRQGLRAWAHAALFPARPSDVIRGGVDVVSHASLLVWEVAPLPPNFRERKKADYTAYRPEDPRVRELIGSMVEHRTLLDATLQVLKDQPAALDWSAAVTHAAFAAGVVVTAGTDEIVSDDDGSMPRIHDELQLLVTRAGLSPLEAITAATRYGARALGLESTRGTLEVGKAADLVVLSADPSKDIGNTRTIVAVYRNGKRYAAAP